MREREREKIHNCFVIVNLYKSLLVLQTLKFLCCTVAYTAKCCYGFKTSTMYTHIFRDATNTKETQNNMSFFSYDKSLYAMMTNFVIHVVIVDRKDI
jgi:hypothetical protein